MPRRSAYPAKILRPANRGALPRERLFSHLDRTADCPLVWVSGPAGSGKTTLVSSYAEARRLPCLWYQVDSGDLDPASFFHYLKLAGDKAAPRRKRLPHFTSEYLRAVPTFSRNFFEALFERMREGSCLVLDNCHEVATEGPFHDAILEAVGRHCGVRLLMISRTDPPSAYARLRVHGDMEVIAGEELRLTLEEVEAIAALRGRGGCQEDLLQVHRMVGGWAAGLQILLEVCRTEDVPLRDLAERIPEVIFEYFGGVVFAQLDEETRKFLLATSYLPDMTPAMAGQLSGHSNPAPLLSALHRQGDFTERRGHVDPVFQYHPLFRKFLLKRAREVMGQEERSALQRKAAALLLIAGRPEDAAALLSEARDWEGLADLINSHAQALLGQGRNATLEGWLRALPEERLRGSPWLLYWLGAARLSYSPAEAQTYFEEAFAGFQEQGERGPGGLLAWAGTLKSIHFAFSNFRAADAWLDVLPGLVGDPADLPPGEISAHVASAVLAILTIHSPEHPDLPSWEERALALEPTIGDRACRLSILFNAGWLRAMRGSRTSAQLLLDRLQQLVRNGPVSPLTETAALWLEGVCCWLYGDLDQATTALRRGVAVGDRTGVKLMHPVILLHLAQVELASGNRIGARDCFSRAKELLPAARPYDRFACLLLMGRVHLVEGSIQEALAEAEEAVVLSRATGGGAAEPYALLLLAEALRAAGSRREAFRQVTDALRSAIRGGSAHYVFSSLLLVAQFHLESGSRSRALAVLRRGLKLGRESEFRRAYGFYGSPALALLCALALEVDVEADYVRSLIRHNDLAPTPAIKVGEEWPWPVRIQTLGRFQIWLHGEPMKVGRKAPRKPLELLKALIALGGHGVPEWSLADALWPDAGGDAAHAALETALYRLRKLLGVRQALVLHEGRLTLDPQYCWVDADALEQLLREAEGAGDGSSCTTPTPRALRERALSLYQGPFLFGVDEAWAILRRNRLRNSCLRAAAAVGTEHEAAGACQQAVEWYRKGLESDPLGEEFYQGLIRCYLRLGRRADALAAYRRCRQVLAKVLRVEPNEATAALVGERVGNAVSPSSAHPDT